jgi:8-oxo-dGTP pyrophosphatase MutT (NUDIX family)
VKLEGSGSARLPDWLKPVEELAASVEAEQLAPRFPHPPANARPAAVLICFADGENGPELLLTERATTLRNHAGQISFPGGAADPEDADAVTTALREAEEEVGLDPDDVLVFGTLSTLWLPPSNFAVTSVLGYWDAPRTLEPVDVREVGGILHHPIHLLIEPSNRFSVEHPTGWRGPAFEVGSEVPLWGFTAGVISRLFEQLGWEKPWDEDVTRPLPELL